MRCSNNLLMRIMRENEVGVENKIFVEISLNL